MSQIRTLSVQRLGQRLARASKGELDQILEGLLDILGGP
jgi:mRNA-degrading endonuclease toxin of MazEF toxin-antitoxin module